MYQAAIHKGKKRTDRNDKHRSLITPEDDQLYGVVKQMMGNGRVKVYCSDEVERIGMICGSMRNRKKRVIIEPGNVVIVSHRGFEDKVDLLYKYTDGEIMELSQYNLIPESILKSIASHDISGRDEEDSGVVYSNIAATSIDDI